MDVRDLMEHTVALPEADNAPLLEVLRDALRDIRDDEVDERVTGECDVVEDALDEPDKDEESVALKRPLIEPDVDADDVCVIELQFR